jgi:hypothetical protein
MINFVEKSSDNLEQSISDYEYVSLSSQTYDCKNLIAGAELIEDLIKEVIALNKKKYSYKIVGIQDTISLKKEYFVFTNSEEIIWGVKDSLTEKVCFLPLDSKVQNVIPSFFKERCQEWCNKIKEYFEIEYNFFGTVKLTAARINDKKILDFSLSGKGTTDELIKKIKILNKLLIPNSIFYCATGNDMVDEIRKCLS